MPIYTKETALYDTGAIQGGISGASQVATNYIYADSTGIKIANGTPETATTYQHQTYDRTEFFVNNESKALIGGSGIRLGKPFEANSNSNESHVKIDYHSLQMIDIEGEPYFYISDLRDENGYMTEVFPERESPLRRFDLRTHAESCVSVKVGGIEYTNYNLTQGTGDSKSYVSLQASTTDEVEIVYVPSINNTWTSKAYTLGKRKDGYIIGMGSIVIGHNCAATGLHSYSEGRENKAYGPESHAEGYSTTAGYFSEYGSVDTGCHAEGYETTAYGMGSHAEGINTRATGTGSHAQNWYTEARSLAQTVIGKHNIVDANDIYAFIIGNGTSADDKSNAFAVKWNGDANVSRILTVRDDAIDRDSTPSENLYSDNHCFDILDKDNELLMRLRSCKYTNGDSVAQILAWNEPDGGGTTVYNGFGVVAKKDGTKTYTMSDPAAFRNAISAQAALSVTTASSGIVTAGSGVTIVAQDYVQYGKIGQISFDFKLSAAKAATADVTIATISDTAHRPKIQTGASFGVSTDIRGAWINSNGQCHVAAAMAANTTYNFWATYIIP